MAKDGREALKAALAALKSKGHPVPAANAGAVASGKFVSRVPKTVHAQRTTRAKAEGVSLNARVLTFITQGPGRKEGRV
jgi:antitoxin HicB